MKTAFLASALIACASFASAEETSSYAVVDVDSAGAGQVEITTQSDGLFTLTLVNCLPLMSAVMDEGANAAELSSDASVTLEEIERGTLRHAIATSACGNG